MFQHRPGPLTVQLMAGLTLTAEAGASAISLRLVQPELKGERVQHHVAAAEAGLGYEPNKRLLRVGALLEHRNEDELDQGAVDHALATPVGVNLLLGKILAQVDDQRGATGLEDAVHLIKR